MADSKEANNNNKPELSIDCPPSTSSAIVDHPSNSSSCCSSSQKLTTANSSSDFIKESEFKEESNEDGLIEAIKQMQLGKRHMIVCDYRSAVPCFEEACKLLDDHFGPGSFECAEVYLLYGSALFEFSRMDEEDIGVVNVEGQNSDSEEEEESNEDDETAQGEEPKAVTKTDEKVESTSEQEKNDKEEESVVTNVEAASTGEEQNDDESSITNAEVAWELLCLAKDCYSNAEPTKENKLNLAEALQKLGELSIEWENHANAVSMFHQCLELRQEVLDPDDRLIALAYYYLGVTFCYKADYENASTCFQNSVQTIESRKENLEKKDTIGFDQFEKDAHLKELSQIESLITDLREKIEDVSERLRNQYETLQNDTKQGESTKSMAATQEKQANDISHLIKRKRESDDSKDNMERSKKICNTNEANGASNGNNTTVADDDAADSNNLSNCTAETK